MKYIDKVLQRTSVQSLREYLLYGITDECYSPKSYEIRIKKAYQNWSNAVMKYDDKGEDSELYKIINDTITEYEHVYMELGIQAGFQLAKALEGENDTDKSTMKYKEMYSSIFQDVTRIIEELQIAQQNTEDMYLSL